MSEHYRLETPPAEIESEAEALARAFNAQFDFEDESLDYNGAYWKYFEEHGSRRLLEYIRSQPESDE